MTMRSQVNVTKQVLRLKALAATTAKTYSEDRVKRAATEASHVLARRIFNGATIGEKPYEMDFKKLLSKYGSEQGVYASMVARDGNQLAVATIILDPSNRVLNRIHADFEKHYG